MVPVLSSPLLASHHHFLLPTLPFLRNQSGIPSNSSKRKFKLHGKIMASTYSSSKATSQNGIFCRRNLVLIGCYTSLSLVLPFSGSGAEEELKMASAQEPNLYRHYVTSTAERDGYLYSLSASTLSKQWNDMGPLLQKTVASFRLLPPTENYVPPYKDPWRFW